MKIRFSSLIVLSVIFCVISAEAEAAPRKPAENAVQNAFVMISPAENAEVVGKRPVIKVEFAEPIAPQSLVVILDGADVTQLLTFTEKGFEYAPPMVVPAGVHAVSMSAAGKDGKQFEKSITFSSRHSKDFEEAYSANEASIIYEKIVDRPDEAVSAPAWKVQGNLMSDSKVKGKEWEFAFTTNLRLLEQNRPVFPPEKEGLDAANWLLTGSYSKESLRFRASLGDVQVNETPYTVSSLARRGGLFNLSYDNCRVSMFSVKSEQVLGFRDVGVEGNQDDHILGISAGAGPFGGRMKFRTIYVTGGEPESSFGIVATPGPKKGDVLGFAVSSDLLENRLRTELEADFSRFDPDTTDEFGRKSDRAYSVKAGGVPGRYNYEAVYEYIGRDYAVVGNQMLQKDKEGFGLRGGANLGVHALNLQASRYHDNVRGDELFPRTFNNQGGIDYSFSKVHNLPMGINYQKSVQESTREPEGSTHVELHTDTVAGRINYAAGKLNMGFQAAYSLMNDRTSINNDTAIITYTVTPAYNAPGMLITPVFSLSRSKYSITGVRTDTYTFTPDLRTKFFREKASFDLGGTYNVVKADDGSIASRTLNAGFRLGYEMPGILKGFAKPVIALRGSYVKVSDRVFSDANRDELTLFLVLAAAMPFSF